MLVAVLMSEGLFFLLRTEDLFPFAALEDDLISARQYLERLIHRIHLVELHRSRLVEILEVRRIHEIAHLNSIYRKAELFHGIGTLIRVHDFWIGSRGHHVDG